MFKYFDKQQAQQFDYIRMPRYLITDKRFEKMSVQSKILYAVLMDRLSLVIKNQWIDEEGRAYIIYPISEVMRELQVSARQVGHYYDELEALGLLEKKSQGRGNSWHIYLKNGCIEDSTAC